MPAPCRPMLASLEAAPLEGGQFAYEPKYDGIRAIAEVAPARGAAAVRLYSRQGRDKTAQFPEVVRALEQFARRGRDGFVLDGEVVALDEGGRPAGFQRLQGRIHLADARAAGRAAGASPVAFIAFDLLRAGDEDLRHLPLAARRERLERLFAAPRPPLLRLSEFVEGDGREMYARAVASGWEGLVAKRLDSRYASGRRSPDWRKIKITHQEEFLVGGWTEPRGTRNGLGALLLGRYEGDALKFVGSVGTGFSEDEIERLRDALGAIEVPASPFADAAEPNERPHWVKPELAAQVRFAEWTADGRLRQPVYLGLRDDADIRRPARRTRAAAPRGAARGPGTAGLSFAITNPDKVLWPRSRLTKGDLIRYYAAMAPVILPVVADRPLVMKRLPNGVDGKSFYQQRAPDPVPEGVRVETLPDDEVPSRLVGGSPSTLLYMAQLAAVSQDPWFSRVQSLAFPDYVAIDLDPMPGVTFAQVLDVARWVREALDGLGVAGFPKTSGADGLHVYVPLQPRTSYETALLFSQLVATLVAEKHSAEATVERAVGLRGRKVYVDYLQNVRGKTLAAAYSARASDYAGVSTPLAWDEVDRGVEREAFTIETVPGRVKLKGDLWSALRRSKGADLKGLVGGRGRKKTAGGR